MSERKVLNKYYPPDFDPSKIPRMKLARNRQYTVRLMAPFNMRCKTCGEYIYKGKKFNARKEDVEGDDYLGIRIYRFYIKCTRCLQEISFKTDPKNTDYEIEAGATRNFMALKLAEEQAQREEDEEKEEEATNPMKLLEKRTLQSKQELELLESLEELKDLNRRQQTIDYDQMLEQFDTTAARQRTEKEQEEVDEEYIKSIFGKKRTNSVIVEEEIVEVDATDQAAPPSKIIKKEIEKDVSVSTSKEKPNEKDVLSFSNKKGLASLVKRKTDLGVKLNVKSDQVESKKQEANKTASLSKDIETASTASTESANIKNNTNSDGSTSIASTTGTASTKGITSTTSCSTNTGLSLLGTYSGSSDNDSD